MGTPVAPGNRGVMALGASLVGLCHEAAPGAEVCFLQLHRPWENVVVQTSTGPCSVPVVTCQLSPKAPRERQLAWILLLAICYRIFPMLRDSIRRRSEWIRTIAEADLVGDIRGGDSFSDIYGLKRFVIAFLVVWTVILVRGSIVHFPQTYGPFKSPVAKKIAAFLLRRSSFVVARDVESQRIAQELIGSKPSVHLSPDVAFSLQSSPPAIIKADPPWKDLPSERLIGINVNGLMYNGGYTRNDMFGLKLDYRAFLPRLVEALLAAHDGDIILVPHTYAREGDVESDNEACLKLRAALSPENARRLTVITGDYDQHEIKGVIGKCGFFIGSRMHACIAALSQGIPCIGVAYSMKFHGVFDSVGVGDWVVDGRTASTEEALSRIMTLFHKRQEASQTLRPRVIAAKAALSDIFAKLLAKES